MSTLIDLALTRSSLPTTKLSILTWILAILFSLVIRLVYWRPLTSPLGKLRGPEGGKGPAGHYIELLE